MTEETQHTLHTILDHAICEEKADMGNIQMYHPAAKQLTIIANRGFDRKFLEHFKVVHAFDATVCGRAIGIGSPVLVNDVEEDKAFLPHRKIARLSGFRAVKSVPIIYKGNPLGVISAHFSEPKKVWGPCRIDRILPELALVMSKAQRPHMLEN